MLRFHLDTNPHFIMNLCVCVCVGNVLLSLQQCVCSLEAMCSRVMGSVFETEAVLTGIIELLIQAQQSSVKIHAVRLVKLPLSPSLFSVSLHYMSVFSFSH